MWKRSIGLGLLTALIIGLGGGCAKSAPAPSVLPPAPVETVAAVHWRGKARLAADTNAAFVMEIWNLAESKKLELQTLDRLAIGLFASNRISVVSNRLSAAGGQSTAGNSQSRPTGPAGLLRPLLDDLVGQESFLELHQATNQPGELAFAIRLNEERARLWQTNLAALLESLTGSRTVAALGRSNGWQLRFNSHWSPSARHIELARAGEWTVLGLGSEHNAVFAEMRDLIQQEGMLSVPGFKDVWFYADVDLRRVASALSLGWDLPEDLPRMTFGVNGDGQTVRTRGQLNFAKPLPFQLEPWNIPTNLIHEPLVSVTAIQGLRPWLASSRLWQGLRLGPPPNQLFLWAQYGPEFLSYIAAPLTNASDCVERATERLLQEPNAFLAAEGLGRFERSTNGVGVLWTDVLLTMPYLKPVALSGGNFVFGGLVPSPLTNRPPPPELIQTVLGSTNLVAYDWELTGRRLDQWLHFGQLLRFALHLAQVPPESVSFAWLKALESRLGNCVTAVTRTGPAQLSLARRSALGFTAAELDLLADWLESPQFPRGLNTFLGKPVRLPRPRPPRVSAGTSTNAVPPVGH